ncbi:MAG: polysaccharide deacetylase family protein [Candidatus Binatia bacterium]
MVSSDFVNAYQWNYRTKRPKRPAWFTEWPRRARIAVTIKIMHEWESVPGVQTMHQRPMPEHTFYTNDFLALSVREYGVNFGFWRLMDILDKHQIKATVITSGLTAELFPESLCEAHRRGHEVVSHQFDQTKHPTEYRSKEEEKIDFVRAMAAIEKATGERPKGYMSQGPRPSPNTLEICAEQGILWNGDYQDSDIPYVINVHGRKMVSVGYVRPGNTDNDVVRNGGPATALDDLKFEFDAHYEEAQRHPMKFCYAMHNYIGGRPGMAKVFDNFLQYIKDLPGVWFCRSIDMANFWLENEKTVEERALQKKAV